MGYLLVNVQLPDAASAERTEEVMRQIERDRPGDARASGTSPASRGQSFVLSANGSNFGSMFVNLEGLSPTGATPTLSSDGHRRRSCASVHGRRSPRRRWPSSGRRRCAAWAGPAASPS